MRTEKKQKNFRLKLKVKVMEKGIFDLDFAIESCSIEEMIETAETYCNILKKAGNEIEEVHIIYGLKPNENEDE